MNEIKTRRIGGDEPRIKPLWKSQSVNEEKSSTSVVKIVLLIIFLVSVLLLGAQIFFWSTPPKTIYDLLFKEFKVQPVKHISRHSSSYDFHAKKFVTSHKLNELKPVLFNKHKIVTNWKALHKWTPENFCKRNFHLYGIYENTEKTFLFHSMQPLSDFISKKLKQPFTLKNDVPICSFLNTLKNPEDPYVYLSQKLQYFGKELDGMNKVKESFLDDLEPNYESFFAQETGRVTNIWFGGKNSTAQCHYDVAHNFFIQIYGRKKFLLLEPTSWKFLYLYPSLHPSYRQSQLNFDAEITNLKSQPPQNFQNSQYTQSFSNSNYIQKTFIPYSQFLNHVKEMHSNVKIYEVIVEPGDVLYIPPFWFHHVESLGTSFSVNMWSNCEEYFVSEKILTSPLPFESYWTKEQRLEGVYTFIRIFISVYNHINNYNSPYISQWLNNVLVKGRYEPLFRSGLLSKDFSMKCPEFNEQFVNKFQSYVEDIVKNTRSLRSGINDIIVGNFIEELVNWSISDTPELVGAFLNSCFTTEETVL